MKLRLLIPRNDTVPDGYFNSSRDLIDEFKRQGVEITTSVFDQADFTLVYGYPTLANKLYQHEPYGVLTMFESTKPPAEWKPYLEHAKFVANPSKWGKECFEKAYGLTDVQVINLAYSQRDFDYIRRDLPRRKFTFLTYNNGFNAQRKGFFELIKAYHMAFRKTDKVKLIVKDMRPDMETANQKFLWSTMSDGWDMEYINEQYTRRQLMGLLAEADAFVFPSRGEGFGHTPLEAMATGLPCIIPNAHGCAEYFDERYCKGYKTYRVPATYSSLPKANYGIEMKADTESLAEAMYEMWQEREEWADKSLLITGHAQRFSYADTVEKLINVINVHLNNPNL